MGLAGRVNFLAMDQNGFDRIELPGLTMDMPAGWQAYRERLVATLPGDAEGLNTFVDICSAVGAEMRETLLSPVELAIQDLIAATPATVAWSRRSLADLFDHCALSTAARSVLAAQSPNTVWARPRPPSARDGDRPLSARRLLPRGRRPGPRRLAGRGDRGTRR
ncbi:hypothetical protein NKG94_03630 [Micromonospora sp. M12]